MLPGNLTPRLQEACVRLSTHIPSFAKAARELAFFTGASLHRDSTRRCSSVSMMGRSFAPQALRILDFPHATEYIIAIGQTQGPDGELLVQKERTRLCHELKHDGAASANWPTPPNCKTLRHTLILQHNWKRPPFKLRSWDLAAVTLARWLNHMRKAFKYRIYLTKGQRGLFEVQLEECGWVYNETLAYRKQVYEQEQRTAHWYETKRLLPDWKAVRPRLKLVHSQVLQNVTQRVDLAFKAFFRRVREGAEEEGFPRAEWSGTR